MQILRQILAGLAHIHSQGIIHRKVLCQLEKASNFKKAALSIAIQQSEPRRTI